jgi:hypothetical protein
VLAADSGNGLIRIGLRSAFREAYSDRDVRDAEEKSKNDCFHSNRLKETTNFHCIPLTLAR